MDVEWGLRKEKIPCEENTLCERCVEGRKETDVRKREKVDHGVKGQRNKYRSGKNQIIQVWKELELCSKSKRKSSHLFKKVSKCLQYTFEGSFLLSIGKCYGMAKNRFREAVRIKSRFFSLTLRFLRIEAKSVSSRHYHFSLTWMFISARTIHSLSPEQNLLNPDFWLSRTPLHSYSFQERGKISSVLSTLVEHCSFLWICQIATRLNI